MSATMALTSPDGRILQIRPIYEEFWERDGPIEANTYALEHDRYIGAQIDGGEIVYHYTTLEGLKGIVGGGELWASDARFMNDRLELKYALDHMQALVASDSTYKIPDAALDAVFKPGRVWQFVACFSRARDQLSQWRAYGSKVGIAIGFDRGHLTRAAEAHQGSVAECSYFDRAEFSAIRDKLGPIARALSAACVPDGKLTDMKLQGALSKSATHIASTIKHHSFAEEREVRVVVSTEKVSETVNFRASPNSLIPFVKIDLDLRRWKVPGKRGRYLNHLGMIELLVWPADVDNQILDAIDMLLVDAGTVLINRSNSPYRT